MPGALTEQAFGIFRYLIALGRLVVCIAFTQIWNEFLFAVTPLDRPLSRLQSLWNLAGGPGCLWTFPWLDRCWPLTYDNNLCFPRTLLRPGFLAGGLKGQGSLWLR